MFIRSQLFHIEQLKPNSLSELKHLLSLLEYSVVFHINKTLIDNAIHIPGIHCNRVPIEYQRSYMEAPFLITCQPEYETLSRNIEIFVKELVNWYKVLNTKDPLSELNVEINAVNKSTLILSYDVY